ncbi:MAG: hypothetical protein E7277_05980 [Lachnospiraceae bacterium]|jgi:hypothetical protein|nr:hypothetical protein [Lachnospiraceae bacterium]
MKTLSLHQPYFFPYIGYFSIMKHVDIHVYADSLQYTRHGWMNRNRILSCENAPLTITVPLKRAARDTAINQMEIAYERTWEQDIYNKLLAYKKRAPYYNEVLDMLDELFAGKYENLAELNIRSNQLVCQRLGIQTPTYRLSELGLAEKENMEPDDWGIVVCKQFEGVDTYRNAPLGKTFYNAEKYRANGLNIEFAQNRLRPYEQGAAEFVPALSILDVMMFNSVDAVNEMLDDYDLL